MSDYERNRRHQARTDEITLSEGMARALQASVLLESEAALILTRNLSTRSPMSTTSAFARRMNLARSNADQFVVIGRGTCGTVLEIPGSRRVIKVGSNANINGLWRDFVFANRARKAMKKATRILHDFALGLKLPHVPRVFEFHRHDDNMFWADDICQRFSEKEHVKRPLFICERVLPIPQETREALIRLFFAPDHREEASKDPDNEACLIRPYFGQNTPFGGEAWFQDTLWNFPLFADNMQTLGLDCIVLVKEMALGLAAIHWGAFIEASDVEFVLGTSAIEPTIPEEYHPIPVNIYQNDFGKRATHLYLFDFDKSREFSLKEPSATIVRKLVVGVTGNDPYYPCPQVNGELWDEFAKAYIEASKRIIAETIVSDTSAADRRRFMDLPEEFIESWKANMRENEGYSAEEMILFEDNGEDGGDGDDQGWGSDEVDEEGESDEESESGEESESDEESESGEESESDEESESGEESESDEESESGEESQSDEGEGGH